MELVPSARGPCRVCLARFVAISLVTLTPEPVPGWASEDVCSHTVLWLVIFLLLVLVHTTKLSTIKNILFLSFAVIVYFDKVFLFNILKGR